MEQPKGTMITRSFVIRLDQEAMLMEFAKEQDRSISGGLRYILDDYVSLKRAALEAARPQEQPI